MESKNTTKYTKKHEGTGYNDTKRMYSIKKRRDTT
jgi:hypothetical protein